MNVSTPICNIFLNFHAFPAWDTHDKRSEFDIVKKQWPIDRLVILMVLQWTDVETNSTPTLGWIDFNDKNQQKMFKTINV